VEADLWDRVERDLPDVRPGAGENRGEVSNPALSSAPPVAEPAEAQEEQRFLLEAEGGYDSAIAFDPGSERETFR
jgi:hypothetical protein